MKRYIIIAILLKCSSALAQTLPKVDSLLLEANYAEAIHIIDKDLKQSIDATTSALLENKKVEALIHLGKFDEAIKVLKQIKQDETSKHADNIFIEAITKTNEGFLSLNQGRNDLAIGQLQQSITYFERAGKNNSLEAAQAFSVLGIAYLNTGKYLQAEEQLQRTLVLRQKNLLSQSHELIAASYNDLGLVYSFQADNTKALNYYEKALAIYIKLHGLEHPKIAIASTNIGAIYRNLDLYEEAIKEFEIALKIWEKVYPAAHPLKAFVISNLAQTYLKKDDQKTAMAFYDRALKMYEESYGKKHPDVATTLNALGNIKLSTNQYDKALLYYQQALKANVVDFENNDVRTNPKLKQYYNGNVLLYSLLFKAQALETRYYRKSLKFNELSYALQTLHTCDTLIDKLRQQITNEGDKIALGVIANEVYSDGVRIAHSAAIQAVQKKKYFEEAFYFAEKSKSAVLLEAVADTEAKSFAGIPTSLLEEEKTIKSALALCIQKLAQKPAPDEEQRLREASFNLNSSYNAFTKKLEVEFPEYFNLKFNAASPSIAQLQSRLDTKTAILSYFVDDKNSRLYIFFIRKDSYQVIDHLLPSQFDKYITGLRNSLFFIDQKTFTVCAQQLYKLLIPKMPESIKELVILPTGRLGIIPFETLLQDDGRKNAMSYSNLPFLIKEVSIRYEFSAGLLLQKKLKEKSIVETPSILLCAPVDFPEKDNLDRLPGTATEVKAISDLFAGKNFSKAVYTNQGAEESLIKSDVIKNYKYLHFATHGIVDEENPELSRIFLQTNSDNEDGNLYAGEIYNLQLRANLVTLSACQTGLGKISKGEGIVGLSRALIYAGAENIIVSFWSVADESTSALMASFYKQMLENASQSFSEDLRNAKLQLLKSDKYAAPYYWAPFILIGF